MYDTLLQKIKKLREAAQSSNDHPMKAIAREYRQLSSATVDQPPTESIDDIILTEVVSLCQDLTAVNEHARESTSVNSAINALSYSELTAAVGVFEELNRSDGLIIATAVAEKLEITRTVLASALKKLESAGVIETRSLGAKGTHIKIINNLIFDKLT